MKIGLLPGTYRTSAIEGAVGNGGVIMRTLMVAMALATCGCSPRVEGHFLSDSSYIHVYKQGSLLLADIQKSGFYSPNTKAGTVSLTNEGEVYRGSTAGLFGAADFRISPTSEGLLVLVSGQKEVLRRIEPIDAPSALDCNAALMAARNELTAEMAKKLEAKYGACGTSSLDSRRRAVLADALANLRVDACEANVAVQGVVWDRFEARAKLHVPPVEKTFPQQKVCSKTKHEFFSTTCIGWEMHDFTARTEAAVIDVVLQVDRSRYPEADARPPNVLLAKIAGKAVETFGSNSLDDQLCRRLLQSDSLLKYHEDRGSKLAAN